MDKECHCGKNGHPLNSVNCPVHAYITVRLEVAKLLVGGCLPRNPLKMRGADPLLVDAIIEFKTTVIAAERGR